MSNEIIWVNTSIICTGKDHDKHHPVPTAFEYTAGIIAL